MYKDCPANDFGLSGMTLMDYFGGLVNAPVSAEGIRTILARRALDPTALFEGETREIELASADLYKWIATSPYRVGSTGDSDNGWEHTSAGWTLTEADRKYYLMLANDIYDKYDEPTVGKSVIKITNHGIRHTDFPLFGCCGRGRNHHSS